MTIKSSSSSVLFLFLVAALQVFGAIRLSLAHDFDLFYFVLQWPASYCATEEGCCFPTTGKPAPDFSIHGLFPYYNNGSYPSDVCDPNGKFDLSKISDLIPSLQRSWPSLACPSGDSTKLWAHEWQKRGSCTTLNEHDYFKLALDLKKRTSRLLDILTSAGIKPGVGKFYRMHTIRLAIIRELGILPGIACNVDASGKSQLYQVYICTDAAGMDLVDCPFLYPRGRCASHKMYFPSFENGYVSNITMVISS